MKKVKSAKEFRVKEFNNTQQFYDYIRLYKDVETPPPDIEKLCFGAELERKNKTYNLLLHLQYLPNKDQAPFEQGDSLPKLFGGYTETKNSHMSTFTMALSEVIARRNSEDIDHEFHVAFVPRKTGAYKQDYFSSGMSQTF